ncbi:hypothetical protein JTB14_016415 [Gonioctena quinquepunctata]|nr:hypothetical protein JTB14_016415 [Gonioctena quinquepunctata]
MQKSHIISIIKVISEQQNFIRNFSIRSFRHNFFEIVDRFSKENKVLVSVRKFVDYYCCVSSSVGQQAQSIKNSKYQKSDYENPRSCQGDITDSNYTLLIAQVPEKEDKLVPVIPCNCTCPYKALLDITVPEAGPAGLCSVVGFHVLPRETIGKCMVLHGLPTSWLASPSKQVLILPKTKFLLSTYTDT